MMIHASMANDIYFTAKSTLSINQYNFRSARHPTFIVQLGLHTKMVEVMDNNL